MMTEVQDDPLRKAVREVMASPKTPASVKNVTDDDLVRWLRSTLRPSVNTSYLGTVGDYGIISIIALGGMGVVFEAEHLPTKTPRAIKLIRPNLLQDKVTKERFIREARAVSGLDHPSLVKMEMQSENDLNFIVMPLLRGETLRERLERKPPIAIDQAITWVREITEGLACVHEHGLIHRDIKPENIYLDQRGDAIHAVLLDFGLARKDGENGITEPGSVVGTVHYMSPEQISGSTVDLKTDLFGLGLITYEMLTGKCVFFRTDKKGKFNFPATIKAILSEKPIPPMAINSRISKNLSDLTMKLLEKKANDRYQSAAEILGLIKQQEVVKTKKSNTPIVVAGLVILAIIIIVLVFAIK
jgi:serine/threonine protein kinase